MTITTKQILNILYILAWIIFIGLCIEAGAFIVTAIIPFFVNTVDIKSLWLGGRLSPLFEYDKGYFLIILLFMLIVVFFKALIFYQIIKLMHDKKLNLMLPFNKELGRFLLNMAYMSLVVGIFSWWGVQQCIWLATKGIAMPAIEDISLGGADVWIFMAIVLYILAQVIKRGIEMQSENELTV